MGFCAHGVLLLVGVKSDRGTGNAGAGFAARPTFGEFQVMCADFILERLDGFFAGCSGHDKGCQNRTASRLQGLVSDCNLPLLHRSHLAVLAVALSMAQLCPTTEVLSTSILLFIYNSCRLYPLRCPISANASRAADADPGSSKREVTLAPDSHDAISFK